MEKETNLVFVASFTLVGAIIGAGILGLPYVFSKSGFLIGLFWLIFLGGVVVFTNLCLGEVILRSKTFHQLPGYAEKYFGNVGKYFMLVAMLIGIYSALLAYILGEGQSLSQLFTGGLNFSFYFGIGFWVLMALLLREGLRGLKKAEFWGVGIIFLIVVFIFIFSLNKINLNNLIYTNFSYVFFPFGVIFFALMGFAAIPEIGRILKSNKKLFKKSVFFGILISVFLYILFVFAFVGMLGQEVSEIATLSFGPLLILLGIFTMFTSYFVLSFALKDILVFDFKKTNVISWFFVFIVPLFLYLIISFFNLAGFVGILSLGGAISGGLTGILILFIAKKAKTKGERKPEYEMPLNWFWVLFMGLLFFLGMIYEIWKFI